MASDHVAITPNMLNTAGSNNMQFIASGTSQGSVSVSVDGLQREAASTPGFTQAFQVSSGATPTNAGFGIITAVNADGNPINPGSLAGRQNAIDSGGFGTQGHIPGLIPTSGQITAGFGPPT